MNSSPTDAELVERVRIQDDEALRLLVERYLPAVYRFCLRYTGSSFEAEDAAQEAFVKAWQNIAKFDTNKSFKTWLFTIAKNNATDSMRRRKSVSFSMLESGHEDGPSFGETIPDPEDLPDEVFARNALGIEVREALTELKPRDRTLLSLRYEEGMSFEDIAGVLNIPANTVRSLHRRALMTLREWFLQKKTPPTP